MDSTPEKEQSTPLEPAPAEPREPYVSSTPTYVRVLALLGALAAVGLCIAYTYSIATGGIFWM